MYLVAMFYLSAGLDFKTLNWSSPGYPKGSEGANIITSNSLPTPALKRPFYFMFVNVATFFSDPRFKLLTY